MRRFLPTVAALVLLAGCTSGASGDSVEAASSTPSPFAACSTPVPSAAVSPGAASPAAASPGVAALQGLSIGCFTGDSPVDLGALRGPAVINIWASFCGPCRTELPVVQKLADKTTGRLTVLGVDSGDRWEAAASFGADHGVSIPTLFDQDRKLAGAVGAISLPSTIFIDANGKMYLHRYSMDAADLSDLLLEHTGLRVEL
ncbi:TlpA family protein disulfide reductase [Actinoplanes palleronii]|uniref:TlpA family protein disulfide reductase n=1 Tax=Actinoplanes palleronii TaxID=113570 RepID=UPI001944C62A|nr:TlpA disulfide reductase family protein [Actinoplanes palleronii]